MMDYITGLVRDTREHPALTLGASPRATLALLAAGRAYAAMQGVDYLTPDHVKTVAPAIFRHRLMLTPDAEIDDVLVDHVIRQTLDRVPVPV